MPSSWPYRAATARDSETETKLRNASQAMVRLVARSPSRCGLGPISRQILIYPVTHWDHDPATSPFASVRRHGEGFRLTNTEVQDYFDLYVDGEPTRFDVEGLYAIPCKGGFWLGVEGNGEDTVNLMVRTDATGAVQEAIELPAEIAANSGKWGIDGITADPRGEKV